jgi:iron complex outermembrane recepter protein
MFKRTKISTAAVLAITAMAGGTAIAQEATQRLEVTGSRILSLNADSASPLQVITGAEIRASGVTNIQDLLLRNPTVGAPTFSRTNSNFDVANSGVAVIDLRSLGEERTLVLVNGKRFVAGVPGTSAVDLNAIPTDFIERIEILTGGASSMYGSDAVAGVVNIILKRDFQGVSLDASIGQSSEGDDDKRKASITWGATADGGKGNVMAHFAVSKQGAVYSRDRDGLGIDNISEANFSGDVNDLFKFRTPFYSGFNPKGRFYTDNGTFIVDPDGTIRAPSTNGPNGDGVNADGFNRQGSRTIAIPTDRYLIAAKGDYEVAEGHRAYLESTYSFAKTTARLEPFPLSSDDIYKADGNVPAEFRIGNGPLVRNPLIPDTIFNGMTSTNADGARVYQFDRRLSEFGDRGARANSDTFRVVSGVKGIVPVGNAWDYDAYGSYAFSKRSQNSSGQVNVLNFRNALEAIPDTNDIDGDGNTTEPICRDANAREQGCVPVNLFGAGNISPAAVKYIQAPSSLSTYVSQQFYGATVSGEPIAMPAGALGVAFGAEYRKEKSLSEFDSLTQLGLNASNATPATEGDYDVKEVFGEVRVPILKDAPFAKALSLQGAVRFSDYSTLGNTTSWNIGAEWSPISDVRVRATRALATRAPNIGELYSPPVQDFPTVTDPCNLVTATATDAKSVRCRAAPGVAANIAANNGVFTLSQADTQGVSGFDRGNPDLKEESGWTTTFGVVYTPRSIPALSRFTFTLDYFDVKISDAIVDTPRSFILDQCYSGDASFCNFITRRDQNVGANSAGSLEFVDAASSNSGGYNTSGIDLTATYADKVGPGNLTARAAWTYLNDGYLVPLPGAERDYFAGEVGSSKNKGSLGLGYGWGAFAINGQFTFIGEASVDDQFLAGFGAARDSVKIPSRTYTDMQASYTVGKIQYYFGVDNLFNTKQQVCDTNGTNLGDEVCSTGAGTDAGTYDAIGRRFYIGLRMSL